MDLVSKYKYFLSNNWIDQDWYFYNTIENIHKDTALTHFQQYKSLKVLVQLWLITTKLKWLPSKKHFKINFDMIKVLFNDNSDHSFKETWKLVLNKLENKLWINWTTTFQQSWEQVTHKVKTNNNKNNNKDKTKEWVCTHTTNSDYLMIRNTITHKEEIMTKKIKTYSITLWLEEFQKRCEIYKMIVDVILKEKLQRYIFFHIETYDFVRFLDTINTFTWTINQILERIIIREKDNPSSVRKIKKFFIQKEKDIPSSTEDISQWPDTWNTLQQQTKNIISTLSPSENDRLLEKFIHTIENNKIGSVYYKKWWLDHPIVQWMYYNFVLSEISHSTTPQ